MSLRKIDAETRLWYWGVLAHLRGGGPPHPIAPGRFGFIVPFLRVLGGPSQTPKSVHRSIWEGLAVVTQGEGYL